MIQDYQNRQSTNLFRSKLVNWQKINLQLIIIYVPASQTCRLAVFSPCLTL